MSASSSCVSRYDIHFNMDGHFSFITRKWTLLAPSDMQFFVFSFFEPAHNIAVVFSFVLRSLRVLIFCTSTTIIISQPLLLAVFLFYFNMEKKFPISTWTDIFLITRKWTLLAYQLICSSLCSLFLNQHTTSLSFFPSFCDHFAFSFFALAQHNYLSTASSCCVSFLYQHGKELSLDRSVLLSWWWGCTSRAVSSIPGCARKQKSGIMSRGSHIPWFFQSVGGRGKEEGVELPS